MRRRTALWICSALGCSREAASASKMASLWLVTESPCARQCAAKVSTWERSSVRVGRFSIRRGSSTPCPRSLHHPCVRLATGATFGGVRSGEGALPIAARALERSWPRLTSERGTLQSGEVLVHELRHLEHG